MFSKLIEVEKIGWNYKNSECGIKTVGNGDFDAHQVSLMRFLIHRLHSGAHSLEVSGILISQQLFSQYMLQAGVFMEPSWVRAQTGRRRKDIIGKDIVKIC